MRPRLPLATPTDRWPVAWVSAAAGALVALAYWQQDPGWLRLGIAALLTAWAGWLVSGVRAPRTVAVLSVAALATAVLIASSDTATLVALRKNWAGWSAAERESRAQRVAASLTDVATVLRDVTQQLAADSSLGGEARERRVRTLSPPLPRGVESALLVYHQGVLVARAGQAHTEFPATDVPGVRLIDGAFHTSLVARARSADGNVEVVSLALVSSAPPADRFARPLLKTLPGGFDVAHTIVESPDSVHVEAGTTVVVVPDGPRRLARVRATTFTEGETRLRYEQQARSRTSVALAIAMIGILVIAWRRPAGTPERMAAAIAVLAGVSMTPLTGLSNVSPLFDPASYFAPMGGSLTATVAALLITAALVLAVLLFALRAREGRYSRFLSISLVIALAVGGPFLLRDLARGIALPVSGAGFGLWIAWQLALALVGAAILLAGATAGRAVLGTRRGLPATVAPMIAAMSGVLAPVLWDAPGAWPAWYPALWILAIATLAITRRGLSQVVAAAVVAGTGAATLTWGATVRARLALAQHDLERIAAVDDNALRLLERFSTALRDETRPVQRSDALLRRYAASELALAGYPARLARWSPEYPDSAVSVLELAPVNDTLGAQAYLAQLARQSNALELRFVDDGPTTLLMAAVPAPDGIVTTIAVPPRTRLLPVDPFAAFTGVTGAVGNAPPYRLEFTVPNAGDSVPRALSWRRRAESMHGDGVAGDASGVRGVHVEVELRGLDALVPRGALLVLVDVGVVMLLWTATALADGALGRWLRVRRVRWSRSYRVRLSGALLMFFIAPAAIFALWAWYRLQDDDRAARELLLRETLRVASTEQEQRMLGTVPSSTGAPLFLYQRGMLTTASDSLLDALAPLGRLTPVTFTDEAIAGEDLFTTRRITVGPVSTLVGYRRVGRLDEPVRDDAMLATPARGDEFALDARREDLGVLLLFATMLGALAAVWSSGIAARSLARPVGVLREAALAVAAGRDAPMLGTAPATEFAPVYRAFGRMAQDLATSRAALEAAQRRTAAVLQHVASGVLAIVDNGDIILANPRAETMLGVTLSTGRASLWQLPRLFDDLVARARRFLVGDAEEDAFDLTLPGRQLRARLTRLPTGAVLTLDDITELASAQRVLAWGEMARQVAHEIKNPLTPIRLGVQHLRRAYRDGRSDFGQILDTNVGRVLAEIDHLDEIARAFSRYGTAPEDRTPAVSVDVAQVVRDVVALERLGDEERRETVQGTVQWIVEIDPRLNGDTLALALRDELREVLINLLENARLAQAGTVTVRLSPCNAPGVLEAWREGRADGLAIDVVDDGVGIAADTLPRVFEPHFSTRTSGSGLGLAISRRLIEGWGGTIGIASTPGTGTTVHIVLRRANDGPEAGRGLPHYS
ncbi:ATP-binding protein [Gemmatimonas aurantiaca]|uniref:ATP-binding protein n=1 Tax=Gemmatimonas aurantiaca TaxID=173480 RepID=UPI00301C42F0